MRLAIIGPYPVNVNTSIDVINGGVQAVIVNMVKGLSMFTDLDVHIITSSSFIDREAVIGINGAHVHTVRLDRKFGNITFYSNTRKRLCKKIHELNPDLIHSHMFGYYTLAALESGHKKVIVSTHGISKVNWGIRYTFVEGIRQYFQDYIYMKCLRESENIIINSPFAKESLTRFKKKDVYELNNPVSDIFFDLDNNAEQGQRILFVGNICETKGIMTLLESVNILKDTFNNLELVIAGQIADQDFYYRALRFIKANGLGNFVNFLGHLHEDALKEQYRKACIFAFPSQQDVAPLALLQAMAAGKAIVTTRVGGIPYIIDDGINGFLIEKKDCNALADKIALFIDNKDLRLELGASAHKKISKDYRINTVTERLYRIYKEVVAAKLALPTQGQSKPR